MEIALVTYQDHGNYHQLNLPNEDDDLINFLRTKELKVTKVIWNDNSVDWQQYNLVIIKSPWDYFNHITEFNEWLTQLDLLQIKVLNPLSVIIWNSDKHYLKDIESAGLSVTPSIFIKKGEEYELTNAFEQFSTNRLIVKPTVSGGAKNTFEVNEANVEEIQENLNLLLEAEDFIVQPFLQEIKEEGEWSFIFFGGEFSHAILKKAKADDFRVQSAFGGTVHPQYPDQELLDQAQAYINQFAKVCLYARVDGTLANGKLMLMELELIEPFLFLDAKKESLENYYQALMKFL